MRSTLRFYLFGGLTGLGCGFFCTVYGPFLRDTLGLSLAAITGINVVCQIVAFLAEIPTGMLADGRSRAWSLRFGALSWAASALVYFFAHSVYSALVAEVLAAFGVAFISGAKQAWLVDALIKDKRVDHTPKAFATEAAVYGSAMVFGGVAGSYITLLNPRLFWLFTAGCFFAAWVVAKFVMNGRGEPDDRLSEFEALKQSWALLRRSSALKWVAGIMLVSGFFAAFNMLWSLHFKDAFGQTVVGWLWLAVYGPCVIAGFAIRRTKVKYGAESFLAVSGLALSGLGLALLPIMSHLAWVVPFVIIHEVGRGVFRPMVDSFINHHCESSFRATFGSMQSFVSSVGLAVVSLLLSLFFLVAPQNNESVNLVWAIGGSLLLIGSIIFFFIRPRAT